MHPILVDLGFFQLSSYGLFVALGYLTGIYWLKRQMRWMPGMNEAKFWNLAYALFFGAILGGKLLYVLVNLEEFRSGSIRWLRDFRYGFVFYGGLLGAVATGSVAVRRLGLPWLATADFLGIAMPLGHAVGRLGCFGAGCCYGRPSSLPWAIAFPAHPASNTPQWLWNVPLHPAQLYEALANALIAGALWRWGLPRLKQGRLAPGALFFSYVALYCAARFVVEFYRGDDRGFMGALSVSQWMSIAGLGAALAWLFWSRRRCA